MSFSTCKLGITRMWGSTTFHCAELQLHLANTFKILGHSFPRLAHWNTFKTSSLGDSWGRPVNEWCWAQMSQPHVWTLAVSIHRCTHQTPESHTSHDDTKLKQLHANSQEPAHLCAALKGKPIFTVAISYTFGALHDLIALADAHPDFHQDIPPEPRLVSLVQRLNPHRSNTYPPASLLSSLNNHRAHSHKVMSFPLTIFYRTSELVGT